MELALTILFAILATFLFADTIAMETDYVRRNGFDKYAGIFIVANLMVVLILIMLIIS